MGLTFTLKDGKPAHRTMGKNVMQYQFQTTKASLLIIVWYYYPFAIIPQESWKTLCTIYEIQENKIQMDGRLSDII